MIDRTPPQFIDGERAILGGLILDSEQFSRVKTVLSREDFYREAHRHIFQAITGLIERDSPVDLVSLPAELKRIGKLEAAGGAAALSELVDAVPSAANIMHYVSLVKEKATLRQLIASSQSIITECYQTNSDFEATINRVEQLALQVAAAKVKPGQKKGELVPFSAVLPETFDEMEARRDRRISRFGIRSGFSKFDQLTAGFQPTDLIIIAGRPSMGKTAFAWNVIRTASPEVTSVFFSVEMGRKQIAQRALSRDAAVNLRRIRTGDLEQNHYDKIVNVAGDLSELQLWLDDSSTLTPAQMRFRLRTLELRQQVRIGLVIVDYIQLLSPSKRGERRERELASISMELKAIAKDFGCPVIALSQLNRELEKRPNKRPILADLRESGCLEQDADLVIALYRPYPYTGQGADRNKGEAIILKQRNGPIGMVPLRWVLETATFEDA